MKARFNSFKDKVISHKWMLLGALLVTLYVFSNYMVGFKLSFTNVNYTFAPFDSAQVATDGPLLSDIADSHYPTIYHAYYNEEGISLWDSNIALGRSAGTIAEYMNPLNWVYLLPFDIAVFLKAFSELAIGFVGMYMFMRSIGVNKYAASLSGVIYIFSASIIVWFGWSHSDVAILAPFLFFSIEKLIDTLQLKYMFLIALIVYLMLIVGMPTYAAYFMYLAGLYIVVFTIKRYWREKRKIVIVGTLFAIGVILAAIVSLPYTITLLGDVVGNGYMDSRAAYGEAKLSWGYIRTILFPYMREGLPMHTNESTLFISAFAVVLFPFSVCNIRQKKRNLFFVFMSVAVFLLIFTDALNLVYTHLPMINSSLKYRVIVLLMFTLSVLTGITLNDCLTNKEYYRRKPWLLAVALLWIAGAVCVICKDIIEPYTKLTCNMAVFMFLLVICVGILVKKDSKWIYALLAVLVSLNSVSFVKDYLPWIAIEAPIVPQATDSVDYLMDNTDNEERVAGIGRWTLFPNTPTYYGLNDIRMHGFEATNADMQAYYKTIDNEAYLTNTRLELNSIENYELLKYMGVKYLYGDSMGDMVAINGDIPHSKVYGTVASYSSISQKIALESNPQMLSILFATYGNAIHSTDDVKVTLMTEDGNRVVFETTFPINRIRDNKNVNILIDSNATIEKGSYIFKLSFGDLQTDTITVWMKESPESVVHGSNGDVSGSVAMWGMYCADDLNIVYQGTDGIVVAAFTECADKVELIDSVKSYNSEDEMLSAMAGAYTDGTMHTLSTDDIQPYDRPLAANEGITSVDYSDDYIAVRCNTACERYIVLNDYYDEDWNAYVNGKPVEIHKVNYMMRGIKVEAGDDILVEFRYKPQQLFVLTFVSLVMFISSVLLFVFWKKTQRIVDMLINKRG